MAHLHQRTVSPWQVAMETNSLHTDAQREGAYVMVGLFLSVLISPVTHHDLRFENATAVLQTVHGTTFIVPTSWDTLFASAFLQLRRWPTFPLSPADRSCTLTWCGGTTTYVTRLPAAPHVSSHVPAGCVAIFMSLSPHCVSVCVCPGEVDDVLDSVCLVHNGGDGHGLVPIMVSQELLLTLTHLLTRYLHNLYWVRSRVYLLMVFLVHLSAHTCFRLRALLLLVI